MAGINDFILRLQQLSSGTVYEAMGRKMADAAHAQAVAGFREQRDPYGKPWAPRTRPTSSWPLLQKTGRGLDGMTARYVGGSIRMRIAGYFKFHQSGTGRMVARMVFPDNAHGLGLWRDPLSKAAVDAVRELVNGRTA